MGRAVQPGDPAALPDAAEAVGCYSATKKYRVFWREPLGGVDSVSFLRVPALARRALAGRRAKPQRGDSPLARRLCGWCRGGTKGQWTGEKGRGTESRVDSVGMSFMLGTHLPVVELALALALALTLTLTLARCRQPGVQRQSVERDAASAKTSRRGRGSGGRMVVVEGDGVSCRRGEHLGDMGRYGEI